MIIVPGAPNTAMMIGGVASGADPLDIYKIDNSVRFNSPDAPYFARTFVTPTDGRKWVFGCWLKRCKFGGDYALIGANQGSGNALRLQIDSSNKFFFYSAANGSGSQTTEIFRDPAAHLHVHLVYDSTQASLQDRLKLYVNNVLQTWTVQSWLSLNATVVINSSGIHSLGSYYNGSYGGNFDGLISTPYFVDGSTPAPTDFGETNSTTGQWRPKAPTGITWGNNGFILDFSDGSSASSTALGKDRSGNNNDWIPTNISVTAGDGNDWLTDTPTNNFCTMNPLALSGNETVEEGGLKTTETSAAAAHAIYGTMLIPQNKIIYFEGKCIRATSDHGAFGLMAYETRGNHLANSWSVEVYRAYKRPNGNKVSTAGDNTGVAYGASYTTGDVVSCIVNMNTGTLEFWKNGVSQGVAFTDLLSAGYSWVPMTESAGGSGADWYMNFDQKAFIHTPPTGAETLCTKNLALPIPKNSEEFFVVRSDSGANIVATVAAARTGWADYIEFYKRKDSTGLWYWRFSSDTGNYIDTSSTAAKTTFPSLSGTEFLGGAIRVSATYGVATGVVTHTNGANTVVSDGLASANKMVWLKREDSTSDHFVYHPKLTTGRLVYFNTIGAETPDSTITTVGTSGFTIHSSAPSGTYRWTCFKDSDGLISLDYYSGNGSSDGPVINTRCTPAFRLAHRINGSGDDWQCHDIASNPTNPATKSSRINKSDAETTGTYPLDLLSNGYKWRQGGSNGNESGGTYIGITFARYAFRYSNAK